MDTFLTKLKIFFNSNKKKYIYNNNINYLYGNIIEVIITIQIIKLPKDAKVNYLQCDTYTYINVPTSGFRN